MKNIYKNVLKKLVFLRISLLNLLSDWINTLKKDFSFHNKHTELLAIWTLLFSTITGLFVMGIKSEIPIILLLVALAIVITFVTTIATTYYLHALKYHKKKQFLPKAHVVLNKSFKLRSLLRFVKIPSKFRNFRHLIKLSYKLAQ